MDIIRTHYLTGHLTVIHGLHGTLSGANTLNGSLTVPTVIAMPYYEGEYEVTPTRETQILNTAHKSMRENVVVNPIPSNYGLVTWTGNHLRIS